MADRMIEAAYLKLVRSTHAIIHERECERCHDRWETAEVPVSKDWTGKDAEHCPFCGGESKTKDTIGASSALGPKPRKISPGVLRIAHSGGRYRRRECQVCHQRWTTGEFRATGKAHPPADECRRCRGAGE